MISVGFLQEAESAVALTDAAVLLAADPSDVKNPASPEEMKQTIDQHVSNISTHITAVYVNELMKSDRVSKEDAEDVAIKHIRFYYN